MKNIFFSLSAFLLLTGCSENKNSDNLDLPEIDTAVNNAIENLQAFGTTIPETVEINSLDGLIVSGNLYEVNSGYPWILLCHQAGYNLHEYDEIAPGLNDLDFNCLAIDQRSGGELSGFSNQTYERAKNKNLSTEYVAAEQDIIAAIDYLADTRGQPVILWGSSYSSALAFHIAAENKNVKAVIAFSPGDYFGSHKPLLNSVIPKITIPFFVTSTQAEAPKIRSILDAVDQDEQQTQFIPQGEGKHGSKALWNDHAGNEEYWLALKNFLSTL